MSEHAEFDCIITQMRSLETLFLSDGDKPVVGKDLLPICEAVRALATKLAELSPTVSEGAAERIGELIN